MITDGRFAGIGALCAVVVLALAPAAGARLQASIDLGGLTLTDVSGSADSATLSTGKLGALFISIDDKANGLDPVCPLVSPKFHGFQCAPGPLVRIDAGAGDDRIDAARVTTPLQVALGPGSDAFLGGSANDTLATLADGQRDVVDCGAGQDAVEGMADPNDEIAASCETAQRSFVPAKLPKTLTVAPNGTVTVPIGNAAVPLAFAATLATAPPKGAGKGKTIAKSSAPQASGPVKLRFKLPKLSSGSLSHRPSVRVQVGVIAIAADGRRFPLSLHSGSPGPLGAIALHDNQLRLQIPAKLRHPHGH